jgi:hypothetical protein
MLKVVPSGVLSPLILVITTMSAMFELAENIMTAMIGLSSSSEKK